MNTRAFTLALTIAGIAMFMVYTYVEDRENEYQRHYGSPTTVIVAQRDIQELELIDDTKVLVKTIPKKFVHSDAFSDIKSVENTIATVSIAKGEVITKPRVTYPGAKTGLSRQVSPDKRAFALNITESQAAGKLIKPGDRVDVIAAIDYSSGRKDMQKTKTILQDVLVLSTGKAMTNSLPIYGVKTPREIKTMNANVYERYNTVTLELSPYEVQKIVFLLVYTGSKPFLSLRNNSDQKQVRIKSTSIYDVLGNDEIADAKNYFSQQNQRGRN